MFRKVIGTPNTDYLLFFYKIISERKIINLFHYNYFSMFNFLKYRKYYSKGSCKFLLQYHLIFVCKYRKKLLKGNLNTDMLQILLDISKKYNFGIRTLQSDIDHIHLLILSDPQTCISQIVRVLKQESTYNIWQKYGDFLKIHFWKERTFWSDGYFVTTCGDCSSETIQHYIDNQGKN